METVEGKRHTTIWISKTNKEQLKEFKPGRCDSMEQWIMELLSFWVENHKDE
jgi:hypothetical protein